MDEKERAELEQLSKKRNRTEQEDSRYRILLEKFFKETLYHGGNEY